MGGGQVVKLGLTQLHIHCCKAQPKGTSSFHIVCDKLVFSKAQRLLSKVVQIYLSIQPSSPKQSILVFIPVQQLLMAQEQYYCVYAYSPLSTHPASPSLSVSSVEVTAGGDLLVITAAVVHRSIGGVNEFHEVFILPGEGPLLQAPSNAFTIHLPIGYDSLL